VGVWGGGAREREKWESEIEFFLASNFCAFQFFSFFFYFVISVIGLLTAALFGDSIFSDTPDSTTVSPGDAMNTDDASCFIPLIMQNRVPGLEEIENEDEKFRHDMAMRPDAVDVDSDIYDRIPVESFGFAMLRGSSGKMTLFMARSCDLFCGCAMSRFYCSYVR
jgi:hypothetical protein